MKAVGAIIKNKQGEILVQKHNKLGKWTIPSGKMDPTETNEVEAVKREIREETGLSITSVSKLSTKTEEYTGLGKVEQILFEAVSYSGVPKNMEPQKHSVQTFMSLEDIKKLGNVSSFLRMYIP